MGSALAKNKQSAEGAADQDQYDAQNSRRC